MPNVAVSTFEKIKFGNRHSKVGRLAHFHKRVWLAFVKFKRQFGVKVQSQEICEGNRVLKELKIFNDWTFAVHVNSPKVAEETVGIFELGASKKLVSYLFDVLSKYRLCKGFPVPSKRTAKDTTGMTVGGTVVLHLRSTQ